MDEFEIDDSCIEDTVHLHAEQQDKAFFYKLLKKFGYDVDDIAEDGKLDIIDPDSTTMRLPKFFLKLNPKHFEEVDKFNYILSKISQETGMSMTKMIAYFVEDFVPPDYLLRNVLQKYNVFKIKQEHNDRA